MKRSPVMVHSQRDKVKSVFGPNLQHALYDKNINQSDLARSVWPQTDELAGAKSRSNISAYISENSLPTRDSLEKICKKLQMKPEDLMPLAGLQMLGFPFPSSEPSGDEEDHALSSAVEIVFLDKEHAHIMVDAIVFRKTALHIARLVNDETVDVDNGYAE